MSKPFTEGRWNPVENLVFSLAELGYPLDAHRSRILDLGCGEGQFVYDLRDKGYDAYGFDLHERVAYRQRGDREYFRFGNPASADPSDTTIVDAGYSIPFPDDHFDLVFSTSVIEHVMDLEIVFEEVARITKPTGAALHCYPVKGVVIEPHTFVPFASRFQSRTYFHFWAALGIRNEFQLGLDAAQTAEANARYCRTGLRYYSDRELTEIGARCYHRVSFVGKRYYDSNVLMRAVWYLRAARSAKLAAFARLSKMSAILLTEKRTARPAR